MMEVLYRIEGMQRELLVKLDAVCSMQADGPCLDHGSTHVALNHEADHAVKTPLDDESDNVDKNSCPSRNETAASLMQRKQTWEDDAEIQYGKSSQDLTALHGAMGWRKSMQNVFVVPQEADWLTRVASGPVWHAVSMTIIVVNTVIIGCEIQLSTSWHLKQSLHKEGNGPEPTDYDGSIFKACETGFLVWMIFEVLVNAYAQKRGFLFGRDAKWNVYDLVVIMLALMMQVLAYASVGFLRVARLCRLAKILRAFRVFSFFRGIRSMLISMSGSLVSLLSAMCVMFIFMYTVALVMMQGIASETLPGGILEGITDGTGINVRTLDMFSPLALGDTHTQQVFMLYGSIERTMMTLFMTISGGIEWKIAAWPMFQLGWVYGCVWTAYIAFMLFGMLNVLTGIFVDAAIQAMMTDRDNIIQTQLEERNSLINMIRGIFLQSDTDGSGEISLDEFVDLLEKPDMVAYLEGMGIDSSEAKGLFRLLDDDGSGVVSIDEFVTGFMRLKGGAKAVDMVMLLYENRKICKKLNRIFKEARSANRSIKIMGAAKAKPCSIAVPVAVEAKPYNVPDSLSIQL